MDFHNFYLIISIVRNDIKGVSEFLEAGADVNHISKESSMPALFVAIDNKNPEICEMLCRWGAYVGPFEPLNTTPLGFLLSKNNAGYQQLDYITLRIILLLLRYGANPDFIESGMLSSRDMLDIIGYTINNRHLVTKTSRIEQMDMDMLYKDDTNMIIDDSMDVNVDDSIDNSIYHNALDEEGNEGYMGDNVIEFKDNIDTTITID